MQLSLGCTCPSRVRPSPFSLSCTHAVYFSRTCLRTNLSAATDPTSSHFSTSRLSMSSSITPEKRWSKFSMHCWMSKYLKTMRPGKQYYLNKAHCSSLSIRLHKCQAIKSATPAHNCKPWLSLGHILIKSFNFLKATRTTITKLLESIIRASKRWSKHTSRRSDLRYKPSLRRSLC